VIASLKDGSGIEIRPIRPDDRENVAAGLNRLGPESIYRRVLAPMESLSEAELDYLTQVDHHHHEALVALVPETQEGLGVARFEREPDEPESRSSPRRWPTTGRGAGSGPGSCAR
jgi:hypothetical protein